MKIRTTKASYAVFRVTPDFVAVTDDNEGMSITNDAEAVTLDLADGFGAERRFFYRDTEGEWTELVHKDGRFTGFRPVGEGWCQTFGLVPPSNKHTVIHPDGRVETKDSPLSLEEMQGLVGGYIERIPMADGRFMVFNEEGKPLRLPVNQKATAFLALAPGGSIFGTAIIVPRHFLEPLPDHDKLREDLKFAVVAAFGGADNPNITLAGSMDKYWRDTLDAVLKGDAEAIEMTRQLAGSIGEDEYDALNDALRAYEEAGLFFEARRGGNPPRGCPPPAKRRVAG
jgi:hypothetical protein